MTRNALENQITPSGKAISCLTVTKYGGSKVSERLILLISSHCFIAREKDGARLFEDREIPQRVDRVYQCNMPASDFQGG